MLVLYKVGALLCLAAFYGIYFGKMILQRRQGIKTDQIGKGDKPKRVILIEIIMKIFTFVTPLAEVAVVIIGKSYLGVMGKVFGIYLCALAVIVFGMAVYTMRDSWRAGIPATDKTEFVSRGIYGYSRNPAFVGFDLMYIGIVLMYCSVWIAIPSVVAIIMFHLQILEEEKFLEQTFKEQYLDYKKKVRRYLGQKPLSLDVIIRDVYVLLFIWGLFYMFTCIAYAGLPSFLFLWPGLSLWSYIRIRMLNAKIKGNGKHINKWLVVLYRMAVIAMVAFFAVTECRIVGAMNEPEENELDYIIVLGAGVNGTVPLRPLKLRIDYAYDYMSRNPDTILVASGGQGFGEDISEAECIRRNLVAKGIDESRILLEEKSTSTEENLKFSKVFIEDDARVGILTNSFHLYRAKKIAGAEGYGEVHGLAGVTLMPMGIHYVVREFFGIVRLMF